jgi:hypothetical protein
LSTDCIEVQQAHILSMRQQLCSQPASHPSHALYFFSHSFILMRYVHIARAFICTARSRSLRRQRASNVAELDKLLVVSHSSECVCAVHFAYSLSARPGLAWHAVNKYCALLGLWILVCFFGRFSRLFLVCLEQ